VVITDESGNLAEGVIGHDQVEVIRIDDISWDEGKDSRSCPSMPRTRCEQSKFFRSRWLRRS
jgi:hypothetical protein